jgi:hypothetical protein
MRNKLTDVFDDYGTGVGCLCCFLVLALVVGMFFFEALIVWALWNGVLAVIFVSVPTISYWMACGIMILCNILIKGTSTIIKRN